MPEQTDMFQKPDLETCPKCLGKLKIGGGLINYCPVCEIQYRKDYHNAEIDEKVLTWSERHFR